MPMGIEEQFSYQALERRERGGYSHINSHSTHSDNQIHSKSTLIHLPLITYPIGSGGSVLQIIRVEQPAVGAVEGVCHCVDDELDGIGLMVRLLLLLLMTCKDKRLPIEVAGVEDVIEAVWRQDRQRYVELSFFPSLCRYEVYEVVVLSDAYATSFYPHTRTFSHLA